MWQIIFHRLFSKKWELFILGMVIIVCTLFSKYVAVTHWQEIGWNLDSYSPLTPVIGIIWSLAGLFVLILRRIKAISLYIMFISGFLYTLLMFWAIWLNV